MMTMINPRNRSIESIRGREIEASVTPDSTLAPLRPDGLGLPALGSMDYQARKTSQLERLLTLESVAYSLSDHRTRSFRWHIFHCFALGPEVLLAGGARFPP